jgi:choline-phosphate cytidylyltransferase
MSKVVITFGTFDVFHVGHLRILERAAGYGERLVVGVSTDQLNMEKKGRSPVYNQDERSEIVGALKCVHEVFLEESLALKHEYICRFQADVMVMGDDWEGKFDEFSSMCNVIYLRRTPSISTTEVIEKIRY